MEAYCMKCKEKRMMALSAGWAVSERHWHRSGLQVRTWVHLPLTLLALRVRLRARAAGGLLPALALGALMLAPTGAIAALERRARRCFLKLALRHHQQQQQERLEPVLGVPVRRAVAAPRGPCGVACSALLPAQNNALKDARSC